MFEIRSLENMKLWLYMFALFIIQAASNKGSSATESTWPIVPPQLKPQPINVSLEISKLNRTFVHESNWPNRGEQQRLGCVSAVALDKNQNVVVFHRGDRIWDSSSFNQNHLFQQRKKGPIRNKTVLAFDRSSGKIVYQWGSNFFFMPHGLHIDQEDNAWITDVALHQVFKFGPRGSSDKPLMTLGTAFVPGTGEKNFCKPTSVAVLENGDFFVADGYCNARIIKYNKHGERILYWGQNSFSGISHEVAPANYFAIPHALTFVPELQLICTADRENGRIQCFHWTNGTFHSQYYNQLIGDRLFSMDYTSANGGQFVIVNGPVAEFGSEDLNPVLGFVMDIKTENILSIFGPNEQIFHNPHDIAVTPDGNEIYVAELNPMRVYKFTRNQSKSLIRHQPLVPYESLTSTGAEVNNDEHVPSATAIIVAILMLLFAVGTFLLAFYVARRRERGCMPFGETKRRHAWEFPTRPDGFKLGNLITQRGVRRNGFEQLDQNASDEEQETTTIALSSSTNDTSDVKKSNNYTTVQYT